MGPQRGSGVRPQHDAEGAGECRTGADGSGGLMDVVRGDGPFFPGI